MKLEQAIQELNDNGYKYVSLFRNGQEITKFNQTGKFDTKLDEIVKRIKQFSGSYVILAKFNRADQPDQFVIDNENATLQENNIIVDQSAKTLENKQVLALSIENEKLKMQCNQQANEIADLENLVAELESTIAEMEANAVETATPTLMENAQNFLSTLMEYGAPLLDQHFALKNQQLEIERMKYGAPKMQAPNTKADPEKIAIRKIGQWVETKIDNEEIYAMLHEISAQSQNVNEFLTQLQNINPELYAEIQNEL
jgi:hypothetical protein